MHHLSTARVPPCRSCPHGGGTTASVTARSAQTGPHPLKAVWDYLEGDIHFQLLQQEYEEKPGMGLRTSGRAIPEVGHMENVDPAWSTALWQQFGAAIDMFDNAVVACPDSLWRERLFSAPPDDPQSPRGEVWRIAYHTLYWLDLYLSSIAEVPGVTPPSPLPAPSLDAEDDPPERPYTKD